MIPALTDINILWYHMWVDSSDSPLELAFRLTDHQFRTMAHKSVVFKAEKDQKVKTPTFVREMYDDIGLWDDCFNSGNLWPHADIAMLEMLKLSKDKKVIPAGHLVELGDKFKSCFPNTHGLLETSPTVVGIDVDTLDIFRFLSGKEYTTRTINRAPVYLNGLVEYFKKLSS